MAAKLMSISNINTSASVSIPVSSIPLLNEYSLFCNTNNGYILKPLFNSYSYCSKSVIFNITKNQIISYVIDDDRKVLIKTIMNAEKFDKYICDQSLNIIIASDDLDKNIKNIKKKNTTTLYISNTNPNQLILSINLNDENDNSNVSNINIKKIYNSVTLDTEDFKYQNTYKINSKEISKNIKEISKMGENINIVCTPKYIIFRYVADDNAVKKEYKFNNSIVNTNAETDENKILYNKFVNSKVLNNVSKSFNVSKHILISISNNLPININIDSESITNTKIYIKTNDLL